MPNESRLQTCTAWRPGVNPTQHRIVDARASRYAGTCARWQRDPEGMRARLTFCHFGVPAGVLNVHRKVLGSATIATAIGRETGLGQAEHAATMAVLDPVRTWRVIILTNALQTQMDTANGLRPP